MESKSILLHRPPKVCARTGCVIEESNVYRGREWKRQNFVLSAPDMELAPKSDGLDAEPWPRRRTA